MNTCETCRYYMASPLQEPCESCHWDGVIGHDPSNWEGPTNADRIRTMTDEELGRFLSGVHNNIGSGRAQIAVWNNSDRPIRIWRTDWLDWLKQECDDNGT